MRACVRACVTDSGIPYVMGGTEMAIFKILVLVGTFFFFVPPRKQAYKSYRMKFFENLKMHKVFCKGYVYV